MVAKNYVKEQKELRHYRLENHLCYTCGDKLPKDYSFSSCEICIEKNKIRRNKRFRIQSEEKMGAPNESYLKKIKECKDKHLCYGCKKPLEEGYTKARCPECLEYQKNHRVRKETIEPQNIKKVDVGDKGQMLQHTIVVDENIEIGIKIPERLGYNEILVLFDSVNRMMKPFIKQEQMFGEAPIPGKHRVHVKMTAEQKKHFINIWDNSKPSERAEELGKVFTEFEGLSYKALARRYYNYKNNK